jgi:hypothetical protein
VNVSLTIYTLFYSVYSGKYLDSISTKPPQTPSKSFPSHTWNTDATHVEAAILPVLWHNSRINKHTPCTRGTTLRRSTCSLAVCSFDMTALIKVHAAIIQKATTSTYNRKTIPTAIALSLLLPTLFVMHISF